MRLGINKLDSVELPKPTYIDEDGNEAEIDLSINPSSKQSYVFENTTNAIKTYFKKNIGEYAPIKAEVGQSTFEWTPLGVGFRDELGNEEWLGRINSAEAEQAEDNKVIYRNLLTGIDDEFIVEQGKLKHNTVLNYKPNYMDTLPGKRIELVVEGIINFSNDIEMYVGEEKQLDTFETSDEITFRNTQGFKTFSLPSPIAYEILTDEDIQCKYEVRKDQTVVTLKIIVPYSWLEDSSRQYPVAIDPTLVNINLSGMPLMVHRTAWSNDGNYFAVGYNYTTKVYRFNKQTNTATELASPVGGYPIRAEMVTFSPNSKFLITSTISASSPLRVYAFDTATQGFTNLVSSVEASYTRYITFNSAGNKIIYPNNFAIHIQDFDPNTGALSTKTSYTTPNRIDKLAITSNDKILIRLEVAGNRLQVNWVTNGNVGTSIPLPSGVNSADVRGFDLSPDNRFIALALATSPYFCICAFDSDKGVIGAPIFPTTPLDMSGVQISFSKKMNYIVVAQNMSWPPVGHQLKIYEFSSKQGVIGQRIDIDPSIPQPATINGNDVTSLTFSPEGDYLLVSVNRNVPNESVYLYKFYYEPENNVFFKDPVTGDYYSDNKGNVLLLIDFGTIIAGQTTQSKKVLLENAYDFDVTNIQLSVINPSQEFKVELSKTEQPFIPQSNLHFQDRLGNRDSIPFYARITSTEQSQGGGMFELLLKCDRA